MSNDEDAYADLGADELRDALRQRESNLMLAAQLGKQLLEKNSALETRVETLEKESAELKERLEHISAQYLHASNELKRAESEKSALFAQVDALHDAARTAAKEHQDRDALATQYRDILAAHETAKRELVRLTDQCNEQAKQLGKAISERAALADKLSELSSDAAEVPRLRAELDKLSGIAARQAALDETLRQLQAENAQLAAELNEKHELEQRVAQLEQRNEMLENQNAETLSLLDDVRATAASLGDTFLAQAGKGGSLADELTGVSATSLTAPPATAAAAAASSAVSDEEAARLREERRRQQELMQLLSQQLKMAEDSMKGKEKEADLLRRELIKREQARKSGYLYKRGYYFGSWKKYFILLESEFLHYGDTPNKAFEGVVILRGARVEHSPATLSKRAFCFAIETMNRTYYLAADTEEEMVDWIVAIMAVIKEVNHPTETAKQIQNEAGTAFIDPRHKQKIDEKKLMAGVFENERRATPVSSFVHTSIKWQMRPPFSDREGNDVTGAGNLLMDSRRPAIEHGWVVLCNCPEAGARTGFVQFDTLEPTDSDGWEYAFAFQSDDWSGECGATSFVRRRRWVTEDGLELLKIRGDPLAARRTPKHITSPPPAVIVGHRPVIAAATTAAAAPQRKRSNASAVNGNTNE